MLQHRIAGSAPLKRWTSAVLWLSLLGSPGVALADAPISERASELFAEGVEALTSRAPGSTVAAYEAFKSAYADSPNWKILGNMGVAAHQLERYGEAKSALNRYLESGGDRLKDEEQEQVRRDLNIINFEGATVRLEVTGSYPLYIVDERIEKGALPVANEYGPFDSMNSTVQLFVRAGEHRIKVAREGYETRNWNVTLEGGQDLTRRFKMVKAAPEVDEVEGLLSSGQMIEPEGPQWRPTVYSLWAGAAVFGGAAVYGFFRRHRAQSNADEKFRVECPGGVVPGNAVCGHTTAGDRNAASWKLGAYVGVGVAATALVAGTALFYWDSPVVAVDEGNPESIAVQAWLNPGGVGLKGQF